MEEKKLAAIALLCSNLHLIPGDYFLGFTTSITSPLQKAGVYYYFSSSSKDAFIYANVSMDETVKYFAVTKTSKTRTSMLVSWNKNKSLVLIPKGEKEKNRMYLDEILDVIEIHSIYDRLLINDDDKKKIISYGSDFCIEKYMDIDEILVPSPDEFSNRFVTEEELNDYSDYYADLDQDGDGGCDVASMFMYEEGMYCGY